MVSRSPLLSGVIPIQSLIKKYNIEPGESLFIDDTVHNIETAGSLGFVTIHLANPDSLKKDLKKIGI